MFVRNKSRNFLSRPDELVDDAMRLFRFLQTFLQLAVNDMMKSFAQNIKSYY